MFGFFDSQQKKMRENASNWIDVANKVWSYRRDQMSPAEAEDLVRRREELRRLLRDKADAARLKLGIESLEGVLARTGGAVYPKGSLAENVEFFLVAAIVIFGIRTYFVQPFKIPTNSMWPTYYGMTAENFPPGEEAPGPVGRLFRLAAYGAQRRTAVAPRDGEVSIVLQASQNSVAYTVADGRSWLVLPAKVKEYTFYVDGAPATVQVPVDFSDRDFDRVVFRTFFKDGAAFAAQYEAALAAGRVESMSGFHGGRLLPVGRRVRAGEPILRFDVMTGDQLFVDRMSYHFVRPSVGQGFVFRTDNIPDIARTFGAQYFIKRLVGTPGDVVEMREPRLYRNGSPITGSVAFELNAQRVPPYLGYFNATREDPRYSLLFKGEPVTVPAGSFLALGDNSHDSFDGRYWGYVPAADVVGRPLFIYYPLTRRWGSAR